MLLLVFHLHKDCDVCVLFSDYADQPWLKRTFSISQVFLPGFLSSNLYYKYLNDLIHSVRGDEFPGGNIALSIHGPGSSPDSDSIGSTDGSASQVPIWVFCVNIQVFTLEGNTIPL